MLHDNDNKLDQVKNFFHSGSHLEFTKNDIIHTSDRNEGLIFSLKTGYIKSYVITANGSLRVLCLYGPGSIFPLGPWFRGGSVSVRYHIQATVHFQAMTAGEIYYRTSKDLVQFMERDTSYYRTLALMLLSNYDLYLARVEGSLYKHAREQVAHQLLSLATRFSSPQNNGEMISLPLTHQDIADIVGISRETVSREIEYLRKNCEVEVESRHITIHNRSKLEELLRSA